MSHTSSLASNLNKSGGSSYPHSSSTSPCSVLVLFEAVDLVYSTVLGPLVSDLVGDVLPLEDPTENVHTNSSSSGRCEVDYGIGFHV